MSYSVKSGDSLSTIARDVLGDMDRWPEIAALNALSPPYTIYPGQLLELPGAPGAVVQPAPAPGVSVSSVLSDRRVWFVAAAVALAWWYLQGTPRRARRRARARRR